MSDGRKAMFRYDPAARKRILQAIGPSDDAVAEELIEMCELVAQTCLDNQEYFASFPSKNESKKHIDAILHHIEQLLKYADFDGDKEKRNRFWVQAVEDEERVKFSDRFYRWSALARSLEAAHHLIRRFSERRFDSLYSNIMISSQNFFLEQIGCVYFSIINRKPGRSKSTIGPFIRFAWAAMVPVFGDSAPSIDSLNERWARMKFDPIRKKLNPVALKEMREDYY